MNDTLTITHRFIVNPLYRRYNGADFVVRSPEQRVADRMDFLKRLPLFANVSDAELALLAKDFTLRRFQQGEAIFFQGDPGQSLYLIEAGRVRIYVQDDGGQETSVIFYSAGDIFGELAVIDGLPRSASAIAVDETFVHVLGRERLRAHLLASPQLAYNFMQALAVRVRYSTLQVGNLTLHDVPGRLARKLLELAQGHGRVTSTGVQIDMTLTQSDLASLIGATRESTNKALGNFKRGGVIRMDNNQITIVDPEALREMGA
jgi:CRP/FNR family transcriptional regulator/CRP/FNR family cyclic AMP-dependent transcriptional regulator